MSQVFVCVIKREKHTIPPAFLEQIAQLASRSDMYVFCPPKYIEEFMRTPKYGNLLVFDLADNDEYDDCEEFYYTVDCDLQNKRIETMVHIANYVLSCGYPLEFFMGLSGKCSETEFAHCKVTVAELERELKTYFSSNDGDSRNGFFDAVRITITR